MLESVRNDIFVQNDILVRNDIFVSEGHFKKKSFTRKKNFSQPFSCLKTISVSPLWPKDSKYAIRFEIRGREGGEKNEHTNPRTISNFNIDCPHKVIESNVLAPLPHSYEGALF